MTQTTQARSRNIAPARADTRNRQSTTANLAKRSLAASVFLLATLVLQPSQATAADTKPYDDKLMRLSEILGAVHYLRELCGSGDDQTWRKQMKDLMDAEGSSALRRASLTRRFNQGYRSYSRTYNTCTPSAKTASDRFLVEGTELAEALLKSVP